MPGCSIIPHLWFYKHLFHSCLCFPPLNNFRSHTWEKCRFFFFNLTSVRLHRKLFNKNAESFSPSKLLTPAAWGPVFCISWPHCQTIRTETSDGRTFLYGWVIFLIVILRRGFILFHFAAQILVKEETHVHDVYVPCSYFGNRLCKKQQYEQSIFLPPVKTQRLAIAFHILACSAEKAWALRWHGECMNPEATCAWGFPDFARIVSMYKYSLN